ncbi:MAG TPA: prolyl oligopeptidase family serine peptidase [Steroidobacteraceae bacterium]|nr:prolyl oligopeptidase family serine peptidase [Steroidobacteraceae bacterium]
MKRLSWPWAAAVCALAATAAAVASAADAARPAQQGITLEKIMSDPDWIGPAVKDAYWSAAGRAVYYSLKRGGSPLADLHRIDLADRKDQVVDAKAMAGADAAAVFDQAGKRAAFVRNGDIFVREVASGRLTQITRTPQKEAAPQFSADGGMLSFRVNNDWFVHEFATGITAPAAIVKTEKDPDAPPKPDDLRDMQLRTFSTLKRLHDDAEMSKRYAADLQKADATRAPAPFYLGEDVSVRDAELSPDAHWLIVVTVPKTAVKGFEGKLTRYVTESGYEEFETERVRVGRNAPAPQSLVLLNLVDHTAHALQIDNLPGIFDDPLKAIREENGTKAGPEDASGGKDSKPKPRGVLMVGDEPDPGAGGIVWSPDGKALAIQVLSLDNKDRWIASVDFVKYALVPQHRLTDAAWVGWSFNEFGWLADSRTLWYESEESGFAHLYTKAPNSEAHALTQGRFEVSDPVLSADGRWFYVLSNLAAPYSYDVYRVPSGGGKLQQVTRLQGVEKFALDQRGRQLLVTHSSPYVRAQIAVLEADGSEAARELTDTRSAQYKSMAWIEPEIVKIPSTHADGMIYAKVYGRAAPTAARRPAVLFVHGAGYTQNVHLRHPYYFREQMFHNFLVQHGYVVLDMDYRASAGYGRDWRAAIYRQMGHPELEDLLDGKKWLAEQASADPKRIGVYGGSYGGFMTLMALFRAPGEFAAGAALRPVTDWMQYDHNYTSAILNDPQIDPIAYVRSSPIEFAGGLRDPLLICHGVIDDNVLFEDSMRLYQRLIELHKDDFTISPYPLDRHAFSNADSWLDEYKRIFRLFEAHLK